MNESVDLSFGDMGCYLTGTTELSLYLNRYMSRERGAPSVQNLETLDEEPTRDY